MAFADAAASARWMGLHPGDVVAGRRNERWIRVRELQRRRRGVAAAAHASGLIAPSPAAHAARQAQLQGLGQRRFPIAGPR